MYQTWPDYTIIYSTVYIWIAVTQYSVIWDLNYTCGTKEMFLRNKFWNYWSECFSIPRKYRKTDINLKRVNYYYTRHSDKRLLSPWIYLYHRVEELTIYSRRILKTNFIQSLSAIHTATISTKEDFLLILKTASDVQTMKGFLSPTHTHTHIYIYIYMCVCVYNSFHNRITMCVCVGVYM